MGLVDGQGVDFHAANIAEVGAVRVGNVTTMTLRRASGFSAVTRRHSSDVLVVKNAQH